MNEPAYPARDGRVFFELARDRLTCQLETLDAVDNKIGMLFSVSTAMLGILGAVLALNGGKLNGLEWAMTALSVIGYIMVTFHARRAYAAKEWKVGGDLRKLWKLYSESDEDDRTLEWRVANSLRIAYEANQPDMTLKLGDLNVILASLVTQSLSLLVALLLVAG